VSHCVFAYILIVTGGNDSTYRGLHLVRPTLRYRAPAAAALLLATLPVSGAGAAPVTGPTIAPDLLSVVGVTATDTDYNGSGTNDTTAVFTFDQPVDATCCAGFELVPIESPGSHFPPSTSSRATAPTSWWSPSRVS